MNGFGRVWVNRIPGWGAIAALCLAVGLALGIALLPLKWAMLLVLAGTVVFVTLIRPQFGVLLLVPAVPFGSLYQVTLGVMNVGVTEALVTLVLAAWLMRLVARREIRISWPPLTLPMALFLGVLCLSSLVSTSLQLSVKEVIKWAEVLALYVLVANEMDGRWTKVLIGVFLGTGALVALQGIYQFLFRVGPEGFVLFGRFMRAYGTFEQPNPYGGYLGLTLPLTVGLIVAALLPRGERIRGWWLIWATVCGVLMLAALIMSWSRGAWFGFAAALLVMALAVVARGRRAVALGVALAVLLVCFVLLAGGGKLIPPSIAQRLNDFLPYLGVTDVRGAEITDANFAVLERMAHWQAALGMWADHPWLGVGIGNYEVAYARYALPLWPLPLGHAHNYYLNIAAEAGILGLAAYLLLWVAALVRSWLTTRQARGWYWGVALGVLGVLVHLSVHDVFDNLYVHSMYLQVAMLLGLRLADQPTPDIAKALGG